MTTLNLAHLHPSAIEVAISSKEDRLEWIKKPRWIGYPRAHDILGQLEDLMRFPRQSRMPNMLLIGDSNSGKTRLVESFIQRYPADENIGGEHIIAKVLYIEAPPGPSETGLYVEILNALFEQVPTSSLEARRARVIEMLNEIQLKVLVIDELHNILAGTTVKQQNMLNVIKYLTNKLQISIVGCGTGDLLRAVSIDTQIQNRFTPVLLPKWKMGKEFQRLLKSFEMILPLQRASTLHDTILSSKILAMSEGTIGEISILLNTATKFAIQSDIECIDQDVLNSCGYVAPSDRTRSAAIV
ncbi:TniB family NTP-binding protein [Undibacterium sp. Ji42W]|uniref:TniB family NTP-binding protein n=1 Tax=Undibacterium sp. Ji42W TaxID=3413039 RepID=UPI003BEF81D9